MARATESDFQYANAELPPATSRATSSPRGPKPRSRLTAHPTTRTRATNARTRTTERRLLEEICSNRI
jgi:hypothetical protein